MVVFLVAVVLTALGVTAFAVVFFAVTATTFAAFLAVATVVTGFEVMTLAVPEVGVLVQYHAPSAKAHALPSAALA